MFSNMETSTAILGGVGISLLGLGIVKAIKDVKSFDKAAEEAAAAPYVVDPTVVDIE